jgi:pimeloyl-ACP methyl ester carboxylesterase
MSCWGVGQPAVFLETGGPAIGEFTGSSLVERLAAETQVCLYNRAGLSPSDPAPDRAREAEDTAEDFHALVQAAGIPPPYVLFGRSFGGMVVTFYASKYPTDVTGVVVFDSPAPSATMTKEQFPEVYGTLRATSSTSTSSPGTRTGSARTPSTSARR